jgi:glutathione peroxidase|tara:strand:+ start:28126 stop:28665 length:540 start_codon:yes stop_codon:yes gene_type:complete
MNGFDRPPPITLASNRQEFKRGAHLRNIMTNPLDIEFLNMNGEATTLRHLGDDTTSSWVVVNVASACGFTRQYAGLQTLSTQDGVTVVGFPCNQYGAQEPGTHEEICSFTESKFNVNFPLMAKIDVKGDEAAPLFQTLSTSSDASGYTGDVRWNFAKFVIDAAGNVARFTSRDEPEDLV